MERPLFSLIVLNWNAASFLPACLNALEALTYPQTEIIVVDNKSSDESVSLVQTTFPQVKLVQNAQNRGFAAGNNNGIRQAKGEIIVLVNPDVELAPGALQPLAEAFAADNSVGIVGGKLHYPDGTLQFGGGDIVPPQAFSSHRTANSDTSESVGYIIGAFMAVRRLVIETIGLMDEGFFLYYEDADYCARARKAGFDIQYVPAASGIHHESSTTDRNTDFYWQHMFYGRVRYLVKHTAENELLTTAMPAERTWLAQLLPGCQRRRMAARVYQTISRQLPEILEARTRDGSEPLSETAIVRLQAELAGLQLLAWQPTLDQLDELAQKGFVQERPFQSRLPLVVWLRNLWISIATKWYMRPQLEQQNQFNQQLVARLREQAERLMIQEQALQETTEDIVRLRQEVKRMKNEG